MQAAERVMVAVKEITTQTEPCWLESPDVQTIWQKLRYTAPFSQDTKWLWHCLALLLLDGRIAGHLGKGPQKGTWWDETVSWREKIMTSTGTKAATTVKNKEKTTGRKRKRDSGGTLMVAVGWMAGAHSEEAAVMEQGMHYVGIDARESVFSPVTNSWVRNINLDLATLSPQQVWEQVAQRAREETGHTGKIVARWLVCGPCCTTYSKRGTTNNSKGTGYRKNNISTKPPVDRTSKWGIAAMEADNMVKRMQSFIQWMSTQNWEGLFWGWVVENPEGMLRNRPFMAKWPLHPNPPQVVHYCAYKWHYYKPTNIWTSVAKWKPQGTSGNGKCAGKHGCKVGYLCTDTNLWRHHNRIGEEKAKQFGKEHKKAWCQAVPHLLHQEILAAAKKVWTLS